MKREFRHENFEEFIKRNADNLRMKAPEGVWQNLSNRLEKGQRRFGVGLSAFFLLASVLSYLTISTNTRSFRPAEQSSPTQITAAPIAATTSRGSGIPPAPASADQKAQESQQQNMQDGSNNQTAAFKPGEKNPISEKPDQPVQGDFEPSVVDDFPDAADAKPAPRSQGNVLLSAAPQSHAAPWTIESVINARLKKRWRENRWQTQYHFTPTISYRKLSENKSYLRNSPQALAQPNYNTLYANINNMVTHKPALGFEVGVTEKYAVSQTVRVRAGLQFNVNRYEIKAFQAAPYALATIALNNRRTARVDSLLTFANYSNVDVNRSNKGSWLQNYSFQVSAPVGVEVALKGTEKMQFGIAATVQPTYVLGDTAYMITSDYKSYTNVPWLLRRWNVNTAFETFVAYQAGNTRWQVGPQVRYQLLSSFITNYPVKENLFDFGLKIGVSVNR